MPQTTISSAAVNDDLSDIAAALTASIAADGQTPITGPLSFADGSASNPGIAFTTDDTDGFYHPASGQLGISLAGVEVALFAAGASVAVNSGGILTVNPPSSTDGSGLLGKDGAVIAPIGAVTNFAGPNAPTGWFLCYGQAVSRTTYAELFAAIGVNYGSGDGSTTFNIPDVRGRFVAGKDNMGGVAAGRITSGASGIGGSTLGGQGGNQNVTLSQGNLPNVNLNLQLNDPGHQHVVFGLDQSGAGAAAGGDRATTNPATDLTSLQFTGITGTASTGGNSTPINSMNPTLIMNKIIFAGHP